MPPNPAPNCVCVMIFLSSSVAPKSMAANTNVVGTCATEGSEGQGRKEGGRRAGGGDEKGDAEVDKERASGLARPSTRMLEWEWEKVSSAGVKKCLHLAGRWSQHTAPR